MSLLPGFLNVSIGARGFLPLAENNIEFDAFTKRVNDAKNVYHNIW